MWDLPLSRGKGQSKVNHLEDMFYSSPETLAKLGAMVRTKHNVLKIDAQ
ncbi:NADH dehydrogenase [Lactiplantibacillus plantarum]|nr:NADH dehydrogenase [Lactiplantibacillus plantarum]